MRTGNAWRGGFIAAVGLATAGCYLSHASVGAGERDAAPRADGGPTTADAGPDVDARAARCRVDTDPRDWPVERFNAGGDYDRPVAAASGVPWFAAREANGNLVFLAVTVDASGVTITDRVELPDTPLYPFGFDTDGARFVALTTTGQNWHGTVEALWFDRASGALTRRVWDALGPDSAFTVRGGAALVGPHAVFAAARADRDELVVEVRDAAFSVVTSATREDIFNPRVLRAGAEVVAVYTGASGRLEVTPTTIALDDVEADGFQVIGRLRDAVVDYGRGFRLRAAEGEWRGESPHSQFSPPAVVRRGGGRIGFSLQKELSGAVGFPHDGRLEWLHVEGTPGARGLGLAVLPVVEERRLGVLYVGLEIPRPEQPLRYFGVACP